MGNGEIMKKFIFSDINDTIKPENGKITNFCIEAIKSLKHKDVEFVLVTGKNRQKTEEFSAVYGGSRYIITSNGGEVFDTEKREVIYYAGICKSTIEKLLDLAKRYGFRFILNVDDDFRYTTRIKYNDGSEKLLESVDDVFKNHKVVGGLFTEIPDELISVVKQEIFETEGITIANQGRNKGNNFIDFVSEYANKGVAIKKLLKHLEADYNNTISIGNERNDIPMFSATKHTIAVDNACDEIKAMVDEVIEGVDDDGVAKYLNSIK